MEYKLIELFEKYHKDNKYTMYAHMNNNLVNLQNHINYKLYNMNGKYTLKYSEQHGGDINEFEYNEKKYIFDVYSKKESDIRKIFIRTFDCKADDIEEGNCALLTYISKSDVINIESLNGLKSCINLKSDKLNDAYKQETMLVYAIIDWSKKKKFKKITLNDIARVKCDDSKLQLTYSLFKVHTLQYGYPWYWKFGFRYISNINNKYIKKNIKIMDDLMTEQMPFEKIINILLTKIINENYIKNKIIEPDNFILKIKLLTDIYNKHMNNKAYEFFKEITLKFCEFMVFIDEDIFKSLKLHLTNNYDKMELIL
jgi:hypothetical protein